MAKEATKIIRFLVKSGNYNPGDIAGFPEKIADRAVARKFAVYYEPPKEQAKKAKQTETAEEAEEESSANARPKLGKNKQMRSSETAAASYQTK